MLTVQARKLPLSMSVVPDKELALEFGRLEAKVKEFLEKMTRLKQENRRLRERLTEMSARNEQAVRRIDAVLDRIDALK
jgi:regulator of replication initiation timing